MKHFPIYLNLSDKHVVVSGTGEIAAAKLRLLLKTEARISVFGENPHTDIPNWAGTGRIKYFRRRVEAPDLRNSLLLYCASGDLEEDSRVAQIGRKLGILVNIVDNLEESAFITPAIVDRNPVTVAISTEGAAPVLARRIKADMEERLPQSIGTLARIGKTFRPLAKKLPAGKERRGFWSEFYFRTGPRALSRGGEICAREALHNLLEDRLAYSAPTGLVSVIGAGPGDPELLTLKARSRLHEADVVIHDRLVPAAILDIARREATIIYAGKTGFGPSSKQSEINRLMVKHARTGCHVVRLKSGDPAIFGRLDEEIDALTAAGIEWEIIPGVTAATAAAASIGVSMTRRSKNSEIRIVTGHDTYGFTEQDWVGLAKPGAVTAIYMGKRAARFLRGRLLMHGASGPTPVTIVENASLPDQKIVSTTLLHLPNSLEANEFKGPTVILLGLAGAAARDAGESLAGLELDSI